MPDDFMDTLENVQAGVHQKNFHEEWIKYILEFPMPNVTFTEKQEIIHMLKPVMDVSSKSNILRREIPMHLDAYDIIWDKYFTYMRKGKYDPALLVVKETLREGFELSINRSVGGEQMKMVFVNKIDMLQRSISDAKQKVGRFIGKKNKETEEGN